MDARGKGLRLNIYGDVVFNPVRCGRGGEGRGWEGRAGQGRAGQGRAGQGRDQGGRRGEGRGGEAGQGSGEERTGREREGKGRKGQGAGAVNGREGRRKEGRTGWCRAQKLLSVIVSQRQSSGLNVSYPDSRSCTLDPITIADIFYKRTLADVRGEVGVERTRVHGERLHPAQHVHHVRRLRAAGGQPLHARDTHGAGGHAGCTHR